MNENLNNPYNRHLSGNSSAWDAFPKEQKVCVITEPLCNNYIKARNYYMARPYNFMMNIDQWSEVAENNIELLMAIRFGMEWDMNKLTDSYLSDPAFHTQMFIRFHNYVLKHAMKEAIKIVAEFQKTAFKVRFMSTFAVDELVELRNLSKFDQANGVYSKINDLKETFSKLNVADATVDLALLRKNNGPLFINRDMFKRIFNQDFNPKMIKIMQESREYRGDPINVRFKDFN